MRCAPVRMPAPAHGTGRGASTIEVRFCDGPAGLELALAEQDRVAVIGGMPEFMSAARAVGVRGSVLGVCAEESLRAAAERERRRGGLHRLRLRLVLRSGGRLVVVEGAPPGGAAVA